MKHLKTFNESLGDKTPNTRKVIVILGLPGGGKSTLAQKIRNEKEDEKFIIYDDMQMNDAINNIGKENIIISDGMLMEQYTSSLSKGGEPHGLTKIRELCKKLNCELIIYAFENDIEKSLQYIYKRWENYTDEEKKKNSHQKPNNLEYYVKSFSKHYKIPKDAILVKW